MEQKGNRKIKNTFEEAGEQIIPSNVTYYQANLKQNNKINWTTSRENCDQVRLKPACSADETS